jgi:hypothetical protein
MLDVEHNGNPAFEDSDIMEGLYERMFDILPFSEDATDLTKLDVMNAIYAKSSYNTPVEKEFRKLIDSRLYHDKATGVKAIYIPAYNTITKPKELVLMFVLNGMRWEPATESHKSKLGDKVKAHYAIDINSLGGTTNVIGFMMYDNGKSDVVFKTRNVVNKRDKGAVCVSKTIMDVQNLIENICFENMFHSGASYDEMIQTSPKSKFAMCLLTEFIFRSMQKQNIDGQIWFIDDPATTISNNL